MAQKVTKWQDLNGQLHDTEAAADAVNQQIKVRSDLDQLFNSHCAMSDTVTCNRDGTYDSMLDFMVLHRERFIAILLHGRPPTA